MKKNGFTLIELLATIIILALVAGFGLYIGIDTINKSKDKSYITTINNIEDITNNYIEENGSYLFYITTKADSTAEYQCVTVQNLIDLGYIKNDVLNSKVAEDITVSANDFVYIERNIQSKAITKIEYLSESDTAARDCSGAIKAVGDVNIAITPDGYSNYKEIIITYKVKNYNSINDYSLDYTYSTQGVLSELSSEGFTKKIKVTDNGTIVANIRYKGETNNIASISAKIVNIDKTAPTIKINGNLTKIYGSSFSLFEGVTISDNNEKDPVSYRKVYVDDVEITSSKNLEIGDNTVKYVVKDQFGNTTEVTRAIKLVVSDKSFDYKASDQIYEVQADGNYYVELWGAQGGSSGGLGGYIKAEVALKTGEELVINSGGIDGYNGGGGYGNSSYIPGGGATTVKKNNQYIVIAGGGGAKTGGTVGGSGNGAGGANVGAGAGINGTNGGGGSNSLNYSYQTCQTCTGACGGYGYYTYSYSCDDVWCHYYDSLLECTPRHKTCTGYNYYCTWYTTYSCNCVNNTTNGKAGNGGLSSVNGAKIITNTPGVRTGNGYAKISYKLEG